MAHRSSGRDRPRSLARHVQGCGSAREVLRRLALASSARTARSAAGISGS